MFFIKKQWLYNAVFCAALIISVVSVTVHNGNDIPAGASPMYSKVIVIDPGHGHPDGGAIGYSGSVEADINLTIAKKLGNYFQQSGAYVIYTRENGTAVAEDLEDKIKNVKREDMKKRKSIKENSEADIFISIHVNKFEESKYRGAQVFYQSDYVESKMLAESIQHQLREVVDTDNTRMAKDSGNSIYLLKNSQIPSVLVECGFISNPEEEKLLTSEDYQDKIAYSIFCGTMDYAANDS